MKNSYSSRHIMVVLSFFYCFSVNIFAQVTQPVPQSLPYSQDFETLLLDYPAGIQGGVIGTGPSNSYPTTDSTADKGFANGTSASGTGAIYNYNGKIGFLNAGSFNLDICLALNTQNKYGIIVQYDAMTIRNPGTRSNEMILQYRVGTLGGFTPLTQTAYQNNLTVQTTAAVTTPQNLKTIKILLPAECENQEVVQIRWISKDVTGSGSRPAFAIDNIGINEDKIAPVSETGYPKTENILSESFEFSNKINEIGKTYYVLLPLGSTTPTITQIKSGLDANDVAALQSGFFDITDNALVYTKTFAGLNLNTGYSVFSISEDQHSNIQSTVNKIDVTTSSVPVPSLTTSITTLDLGFSESTFTSDVFSYQIQGSNITDNVVVTAPVNFEVSKDNSNFLSALTYDAADFASNAALTVYVHFTPTATGAFSGQIKHESTGAATKNLTVTGAGINPYEQGFNDVNALTNSGWKQYNVAGNVNKWVSTTTVRNINSGSGAVVINGFSDSGPSSDWLISPKLHLDNFSQFPLLSFYSRKFYDGPDLKLMVSVNYDGKSNPQTATWTELQTDFPTITGVYKQSQYIDLEAYKTGNTYLAWVYETTSGVTGLAAEWSLDDVKITNETRYVGSNPTFDFGDVTANTISASQSFVFKAPGYDDITIAAPADYQISLDDTSFTSNVLVSAIDAAAGKTVYVRFTPSVKALSISGVLTLTGTDLNKQIGSLTGSSILKAETFDVVTYNLEFFGTDVRGTDNVEFGPTNDALQIKNVAKVMNKLNADVYVVQEVSDDPSLNLLIDEININGKTFDKSISTSWSYSFNPLEPNFPPQKLVVLYNTQTTTVKSTKVLFKDLYDQVRAGTTILPGYPGSGTPQTNDDSFFSSGRLPYLVEIETNIGGIKKEINLIDLHARANSGSDIMKYNQRKYDAEYLKQALDTEYPDANLIILGDFNDDVKASVVTPNPSSYKMFVDDTTNYTALTLGISQAGAYSYLSSNGFLDHIMISDELNDQYIANSIAVYDPRADISNYTTTTSDHGPVIARFELKEGNLATIDFENNEFAVNTFPNPAADKVNILIKSKEVKNLKVRLYNLNGSLIGKPIDILESREGGTVEIPVSHLQSGIYVYTLTENNKVVFKGKVLKK